MSDPEAVSRWARGFVLASAGFLVAWQAIGVLGMRRRVAVTLGLYGFVMHVIFGKAYSLIPAYFDRTLATSRAMPAHLGLTVTGVVALAAGYWRESLVLQRAGWTLWLGGVALFVAAIALTIRDNLTGARTGTSDANAHRRGVDRVANAFVPVALGYVFLGTYVASAPALGLPIVGDGYGPRATHLVALGGAALLVFAVGFRLLPRFLVSTPPRWLAGVTLPAGAAAPALLAATLWEGPWFAAAATLESVAFAGFALAYVSMFARSDRDRVGLYGVLGGVAAGTAGIAIGLWFAFVGAAPGLVLLHLRLNLLGFLGLTIIGVAYQFYPPAVGSFPGASDRTAGG